MSLQDKRFQGLVWKGQQELNHLTSFLLYLWAQSLSRVRTLCDPVDCKPPGSSLSMEFSRQEYWSGLPFPTPGHLLDPRVEPMSSTSPVLTGGFFTTELPGKPSSLLWVLPKKFCKSSFLFPTCLGWNLDVDSYRDGNGSDKRAQNPPSTDP